MRDGTIGNVHTLESHTRRGYSKIVVGYLGERMQEEGIHPICDIVMGNVASENLFMKFGYRPIGESDWCYVDNGRYSGDMNEYIWREASKEDMDLILGMVERTLSGDVVSSVQTSVRTCIEEERLTIMLPRVTGRVKTCLGFYSINRETGSIGHITVGYGLLYRGYEHGLLSHGIQSLPSCPRVTVDLRHTHAITAGHIKSLLSNMGGILSVPVDITEAG